MTKKSLIRGAQKMAAAAAGALFVGSLLVIPAHAASKQKAGKIDQSVTVENGGIGSVAVMGGTANTYVGSVIAKKGATQDLGEVTSKVSVKNGGIGSVSVMKGSTATTSVGSVVAE
jgi:hypothetical protein